MFILSESFPFLDEVCTEYTVGKYRLNSVCLSRLSLGREARERGEIFDIFYFRKKVILYFKYLFGLKVSISIFSKCLPFLYMKG